MPWAGTLNISPHQGKWCFFWLYSVFILVISFSHFKVEPVQIPEEPSYNDSMDLTTSGPV